ncbi:DUF2231 domain-containing protein [Deminuibacter soli]|uniref:DUF2231 domain-containing protein n=1 Tax=Deminuibacter soli TaxID=2291815 RepID=A0A3E1NEV8_9BACT|nr:DUF2231 domain-containing protein [Deminuibacter soli]RFM26334.1 DUF2231 domain-containing protein [Deminuibacter soli]
MQSKANIKGHPLHPILIVFPVAFFTGTLFFDCWGAFSDHAPYFDTAYHLQVLGIFTALVAAVPGFIDYLRVVPPESSAKKRATSHGLLNIGMTIMFSIACIYRQSLNAHITVLLLLETAGFACMAIAGWMGGTLVYRNQIAVHNLYAEAGKWKEELIDTPGKSFVVAASGELKVNQLKLVIINGKRIAIGKTAEGYVAFDDHCSHKGGSLADGAMICGTVQCPWHGSQFSVTTGAVKAGPAKEAIPVYPVSEHDGKVYVTLE